MDFAKKCTICLVGGTGKSNVAQFVRYNKRKLYDHCVAAYVSNNPLPVGELAKLIGDIHAALKGIGTPAIEPVIKQEPAVSIRKS